MHRVLLLYVTAVFKMLQTQNIILIKITKVTKNSLISCHFFKKNYFFLLLQTRIHLYLNYVPNSFYWLNIYKMTVFSVSRLLP